MRLIVFGASRGVGRALTDLALQNGHQVTAVSRNPGGLDGVHPSLEIVTADVTDAGSVKEALSKQDMVFVTLGADNRRTTTLYSVAARNIATAMEHQGVRRLVFLSNFGVLDERASDWRTAITVFMVKKAVKGTLDDHRRALDELQRHSIEWVAVRPMALTNGERTGRYRVVLEGLPEGGTHISRADVADFMLKQLDDDRYLHKTPAVAY